MERKLREKEEKKTNVKRVDLSLAENKLVLKGFQLDLAVGNHFVHRCFPLRFLRSDRFLDDLWNALIVFVQHVEHLLVLCLQLHAKLPQFGLFTNKTALSTTWLSVFCRES